MIRCELQKNVKKKLPLSYSFKSKKQRFFSIFFEAAGKWQHAALQQFESSDSWRPQSHFHGDSTKNNGFSEFFSKLRESGSTRPRCNLNRPTHVGHIATFPHLLVCCWDDCHIMCGSGILFFNHECILFDVEFCGSCRQKYLIQNEYFYVSTYILSSCYVLLALSH